MTGPVLVTLAEALQRKPRCPIVQKPPLSSGSNSSSFNGAPSLRETPKVAPCSFLDCLMVPVAAVEWCGWSIASPRLSLDQERWDLSPPS
jgi:hypothetical protein